MTDAPQRARASGAVPRPDAGPAPQLDRLDSALVKLCLIVVLGSAVTTLDTTVVNVALDNIGRGFHAPVSMVQWISTGYLLAISVVIPVSGWAIDRFGAKRVWMCALCLFLGGSVLCGVAWSITSLIAFRLVQGLGGGMIAPLAQTILARAAGPKRIGRAMTFVSIPTQFAPIIGPTVGGVIVDGLGWRWIFYVNVPICLVALILAWRGLADDTGQPAQRLDIRGLLLLSGGLGSLVYGLSLLGGGTLGNGTAVITQPAVMSAAGVLLLLGFVVHALRTRRTPIIDLRLFRSRSFAMVSTLMFLFGVSLFGMMFLLPLYYQVTQGKGALEAGLLLAPQGVGTVLALLIVGRWTDRIGARPIVLGGLIVSIIGTLAFTQVHADTAELLLAASLVVRGIGLGAAAVPLMAAVYQGGLRPADIPRATSAVNIFQRVGGSFGTAVLAVLLQRQIEGAAGVAAVATGFGHVFWWTIVFTALALVPAWLLPKDKPRDDAQLE